MADDDRNRYGAVLELSRVTRLKGRGDATLPAGLPVMARLPATITEARGRAASARSASRLPPTLLPLR